jgi:hypothetical protein
MRAISLLSFLLLPNLAVSATTNTFLMGILVQDQIGHSGGCRKSSPPGQCCHMEHATGLVHCH